MNRPTLGLYQRASMWLKPLMISRYLPVYWYGIKLLVRVWMLLAL
ncbi:hypothetical protein QWZ13_09550 [Reinekea marina]|nr:hypothetical protein [Reinekea marina]MDN3649154.1 hypothetical protein [Reinekea marina]